MSGKARLVVLGVCLAATLGLLAFHTTVFFETWNDELIHMYVAHRMADGGVLYKDIHSARPPIAMLPLAGLQWIGISPLLAARSLTCALAICTGLFLFWVGRRLFGWLTGAFAYGLFILSPDVIIRHVYTGIQMVAFWCTLVVGFALVGYPLIAGIAAGLALASGQHAAVVLGLVGLYVILRQPKDLVRFVGGFFLSFAPVILYYAISSGRGMFDDLIAMHLYHFKNQSLTDTPTLRWDVITWAFDSALFLVFLGVAMWPRRLVWTGIKDVRNFLLRPEQVIGLITLAFYAVVCLMKGGLALYTSVPYPLLVLGAAIGLGRFAEVVQEKAASEVGSRKALLWIRRFALPVAGVTLVGFWSASDRYAIRDDLRYGIFPPGRAQQMAYMQHLKGVQKIVDFINKESPSNGTVFGAAPLSPLVALMSGRRVSGDLADLAPRWIQMGQIKREQIVQSIESDNVAFFVTPRWFFFRDPYFSKYLGRCFEKPMVYVKEKSGPGSGLPDLLLFKHTGERPCDLNQVSGSEPTKAEAGSKATPG